MNNTEKVAVCSRSFSSNTYLREKLCSSYLHVKFNDDGVVLQGDNLVQYLSGHQKAIVGLESISADVLSRLPDLQVVSKFGVGLDGLDLTAMQNAGIKIGWESGVNCRSVSELVLAVAILLVRKANEANSDVRRGVWQQKVGNLLSGKVVGIVGCGAIGKDLVSLLQPFGCEILAYDIRDYSEFYKKHRVNEVSLNDLLQESDLVTIHLPLDQSTENMFSREILSQLKRGVVLLNAARGGIVDEHALKDLLLSGHIAAAGFDVFRVEPPEDLELLGLPNFYATPHIGGSAEEAVLAMGEAAIRGLDQCVEPRAIYRTSARCDIKK